MFTTRLAHMVALFVGALALLTHGCGDDATSPGGDAGAGTDGSSIDATSEDGGSTSDGGGTDAALKDGSLSDATVEPQPPKITSVSWEPAGDCELNTPSDLTVNIAVTDPDTPLNALAATLSIFGCRPASMEPVGSSLVVTMTCNNMGASLGTVTVSDQDANSDTLSGLTVLPCTEGSQAAE